MSAFSFDACSESFVKARNRFADCFIRQIVPDSLHSAQPFSDPLHSVWCLPRCMQCRRGVVTRILSVRPSVKLLLYYYYYKICIAHKFKRARVRGADLWQNGRKIGPDFFISYERSFSLFFWEEEWLVEGDRFYLKFWVNWPRLERNRRFSTDIRP